MARDVRLIRSPLSIVGMVITTTTAVVFLVVFLADLFGLHTNPYLGIIFFIVLPSWFARSKVSGTLQVLAVSFHTYSRPIPSPVQNLRPAREVCEQCHWPEKFHGDIIRRVYEYADDEKNTENVTTLRVHVGGGSERL